MSTHAAAIHSGKLIFLMNSNVASASNAQQKSPSIDSQMTSFALCCFCLLSVLCLIPLCTTFLWIASQKKEMDGNNWNCSHTVSIILSAGKFCLFLNDHISSSADVIFCAHYAFGSNYSLPLYLLSLLSVEHKGKPR